LSGDWTLSDDRGQYTCAITLPTDGITALHDAGLIPDPYWGRNEYDLRWIAERDWTATRAVTLDRTDVALVLSGVDTIVDVRVNGAHVFTCDNAFRTFRIRLGDVAKVGENEISLTFKDSIAHAAELQAKQPFYLPYQEGNNPIPNVNLLRKPQCDYGWDWNIALAPFGVYGDMRIEAEKTPRIDAVQVHQDHDAGGVTLRINVQTTDVVGALTFAVGVSTASAQVVHGQCIASVRVQDPELWWPAGQGAQPLYTLTVSGEGVEETRKIGVRRLEFVTEEDERGLGFKFRVNGRDIFAKGANWIPADALAGRITPAKTRDLLQSAVDANMNMIRVWGGGRYEADWFYDLCDELGLMVWQDFMFSCNIYPSDREYLANVRAEAVENVRRLQHHASLALWCGDNELVGALTWFEETRADRDRYLANYDRLNRTLEDALLATDPEANWWPSSPCAGPLNFADTWHNDGSGDMHFWSVWHEGRDFDHYRDVAPRFCSEFGFQSYPSMTTVNSFAAPEDQNIAAPVLESHQKNAGGNARIAETMFRYFRWPTQFPDFVYLSQVQQALAIKTAVTHWRSLKPHCMGTLYWQLNDTWPVCSWASLNYGGDWKLLHHMARDFYAPVIITAVPDGDDIRLVGVNDGAACGVTVEVSALAMDGTLRVLATVGGDLGADAATLATVPLADLGPQEMLYFRWTTSDGATGTDHYAPRPYKSYDLQASGLSLSQDGNRLTVSSTGLALFAAVEADVAGRFDKNAFLLLPCQKTEITFTPAAPDATPTFTLRDLHSATYSQ
jgi:beta-mannosidase